VEQDGLVIVVVELYSLDLDHMSSKVSAGVNDEERHLSTLRVPGGREDLGGLDLRSNRGRGTVGALPFIGADLVGRCV
jgi:hypothetical protein